VTAEDRERLTPRMAPRRREELLAGRALLRHALAAYTGRDAATFRLVVTAAGKPECAGGPALSLSHSGDVVLCALAEAPVGVDVEAGPPRDAAALAERYFTTLEAAWVAADPAARFCQLWVLKEAYLKATGLGLEGGLDALECRVELPRIAARLTGGGTPPELALLRGKGCFAGVAVLGGNGPIELVLHAFTEGRGRAGARAPLELVAAT
jgi:phosphopantetheinyl transferase